LPITSNLKPVITTIEHFNLPPGVLEMRRIDDMSSDQRSAFNRDQQFFSLKPRIQPINLIYPASGMDSDFYYFLPRIFHRIEQNYYSACCGSTSKHTKVPACYVSFLAEGETN